MQYVLHHSASLLSGAKAVPSRSGETPAEVVEGESFGELIQNVNDPDPPGDVVAFLANPSGRAVVPLPEMVAEGASDWDVDVQADDVHGIETVRHLVDELPLEPRHIAQPSLVGSHDDRALSKTDAKDMDTGVVAMPEASRVDAREAQVQATWNGRDAPMLGQVAAKDPPARGDVDSHADREERPSINPFLVGQPATVPKQNEQLQGLPPGQEELPAFKREPSRPASLENSRVVLDDLKPSVTPPGETECQSIARTEPPETEVTTEEKNIAQHLSERTPHRTQAHANTARTETKFASETSTAPATTSRPTIDVVAKARSAPDPLSNPPEVKVLDLEEALGKSEPREFVHLASGERPLTVPPTARSHLTPVSAMHALRTASNQVAEVTRDAASGAVEVRLDPEELGRLSISFSSRDAALTVTILADRPDTIELVRRSMGEFLQDLRDLGFQNLSVDVGSSQGEGFSSMGEGPTEVIPLAGDAQEGDQPATPLPTHASRSAGLDMRL
ncbi:flagellar hook-length control protein FliK [Tropicimonas isoalkanivorans]|uniref:Hook-length control protein FliK n=1 Tax=Tropicimonas isoalkanivorans TaxID=441112 RepID=A0A1I1QJX5_9RHOB|nr:flagellar hook-length control protein FliK [Tropicimonas isoalkanivorans]SFD18410.1 hook-length control protein FliK [Tropicimonas isoalkanivorans]